MIIQPAEKVRRMLSLGIDAMMEISETYCSDTRADQEQLLRDYEEALEELALFEAKVAGISALAERRKFRSSPNLLDADASGAERSARAIQVPDAPVNKLVDEDEYEPNLNLSQEDER